MTNENRQKLLEACELLESANFKIKEALEDLQLSKEITDRLASVIDDILPEV